MDWIACVGLDWGSREHAFEIEDGSHPRSTGVVGSAPEKIHDWVRRLRARYPDGVIAVAVEQGRGGVIAALSMYDFIAIIPINPRASSRYRESLRLSGASSDGSDAHLLCDFAVKHEDLRVLEPQDDLSRKLRLLADTRRRLVDQRTAFTHQLKATLDGYYPQAAEWFGGEGAKLLWSLLDRWPTLQAMKRVTSDQLTKAMKACGCRKIAQRVPVLLEQIALAEPLTNDTVIVETHGMLVQALVALVEPLDEQIAKYDTAIDVLWSSHPDHDLFAALPGAGAVLAPRLAAVFGIDRSRYGHARELQCYSGIAPVKEQSGKSFTIHARHGAPTFYRQTFHEFADASRSKSPWAQAVYEEQRARGAKHHHAVRALAFRWIRILYRMWQTGDAYNEQRHVTELARRNSPISNRVRSAA